ncbi:hypothetical protein [Streptomyces sp. NPDC088725]|uniref:hypothetical protein n=1 Tax=Streptomyces sp. NPDC088725 TaxID=3365873 RepID=UPI00382D4355
MGEKRRVRRLVVGDATWLWAVRHRCGRRDGRFGCRETLSLHREEAGTTLRLVFSAGPGRFVPEYTGHTGSVSNGTDHLNLNEPGVVRRLLDLAVAHDAVPGSPGTKEIDAWPLFDAVVGPDRPLG